MWRNLSWRDWLSLASSLSPFATGAVAFVLGWIKQESPDSPTWATIIYAFIAVAVAAIVVDYARRMIRFFSAVRRTRMAISLNSPSLGVQPLKLFDSRLFVHHVRGGELHNVHVTITNIAVIHPNDEKTATLASHFLSTPLSEPHPRGGENANKIQMGGRSERRFIRIGKNDSDWGMEGIDIFYVPHETDPNRIYKMPACVAFVTVTATADDSHACKADFLVRGDHNNGLLISQVDAALPLRKAIAEFAATA